MPETIILASTSPSRQALLANAGVACEAEAPQIDERAIEAALQGSGLGPDGLAEVLAEAKASEVSARRPGRLVLGCDQTLSLDGRMFHKPVDMEAARRHLLELSGRSHRLNSAAALVRDGATLWRHTGIAEMTMRKLEPAFVGRHLARVGGKALASVGAYQLEGEGIQLFESIDGDHFTIVGLPLLAVLAALRDLGAIDA